MVLRAGYKSIISKAIFEDGYCHPNLFYLHLAGDKMTKNYFWEEYGIPNVLKTFGLIYYCD